MYKTSENNDNTVENLKNEIREKFGYRVDEGSWVMMPLPKTSDPSTVADLDDVEHTLGASQFLSYENMSNEAMKTPERAKLTRTVSSSSESYETLKSSEFCCELSTHEDQGSSYDRSKCRLFSSRRQLFQPFLQKERLQLWNGDKHGARSFNQLMSEFQGGKIEDMYSDLEEMQVEYSSEEEDEDDEEMHIDFSDEEDDYVPFEYI